MFESEKYHWIKRFNENENKLNETDFNKKLRMCYFELKQLIGHLSISIGS